jgi:aryl-alcohol dehydrogenase-like predicted oxidoreductase
MERRSLPGVPQGTSVVGLAVDTMVAVGGLSGPAELGVGLLRRARALGITVFDAGTGSAAPVAERWIGRAVRPDDRDALVITSLSSGPPEDPQEGCRASAARLGGRPIDLLMVPAREALDPRGLQRLTRLVEGGSVRSWGVALGPQPSGLEELRSLLESGVRTLKLPYSLLQREPAETILQLAERHEVQCIVTDPFARGRLDGGSLRGGPLDPSHPPERMEQLLREYAPVLALAPLTVRHRRTLPQAALQFVLRSPSVAAVLVAPTGPDQLEPWARLEALPPLEGEELRPLTVRGKA